MITPLCAAAHLLTRDEARRIVNIAKLSKLPSRRAGAVNCHGRSRVAA
jgi:hypothetical protein